MTGLSNYSAKNLLNYVTGISDVPSLPAAAFLALFTAVGNDSGSGLVEPTSGTGYQRVQIAGSLLTTSSTASGSPILNITGVPAWVQIGMLVTDFTSGSAIPNDSLVIAKAANSITLSNILVGNVASGDSIRLTSFGIIVPSTVNSPYSLTNSAPISYPQATPGGPGYGVCPAFGIYDASGIGAGNLLVWDFFGQYLWAPFFSASGISGSGAVFQQAANGLSNGNGVIVSAEFGGTLPTVIQGALSGYALNYAANVTPDNYTLSSSQTSPSSGNAVWASTTGNGQARRVDAINVAGGITETIPARSIFISTFVTPPLSLPLDKVSGAAAAYSYRKLSSSYFGDPMQAERNSDFATQDIPFIGDNFDAVAFQNFIDVHDGSIPIWYDQSGNSNNALNSDFSTQPAVFESAGFYGSIGGAGSTQILEAPSGVSINNLFTSGASLIVVARTLLITGFAQTMCGKGGSAWAFYTYPTDGIMKPWFIQNGTGGGAFWNGNLGVTADGAIHIFEIQYDSSSSANDPTFFIDGVQATIETTNHYGGSPVSDADTGLQLLNSQSLGASKNLSWDGPIYEEYFYPRILSSGERTILINDIKAFYGIP